MTDHNSRIIITYCGSERRVWRSSVCLNLRAYEGTIAGKDVDISRTITLLVRLARFSAAHQLPVISRCTFGKLYVRVEDGYTDLHYSMRSTARPSHNIAVEESSPSVLLCYRENLVSIGLCWGLFQKCKPLAAFGCRSLHQLVTQTEASTRIHITLAASSSALPSSAEGLFATHG